MLNREIIKNGFPFAVFDDPNRLDFYSEEECLNEIMKGWDNFNQIKKRELIQEFPSTAKFLAEGQIYLITFSDTASSNGQSKAAELTTNKPHTAMLKSLGQHIAAVNLTPNFAIDCSENNVESTNLLSDIPVSASQFLAEEKTILTL